MGDDNVQMGVAVQIIQSQGRGIVNVHPRQILVRGETSVTMTWKPCDRVGKVVVIASHRQVQMAVAVEIARRDTASIGRPEEVRARGETPAPQIQEHGHRRTAVVPRDEIGAGVPVQVGGHQGGG